MSSGKASTSRLPNQASTTTSERPWVHFVAGGIGGMAGAIVTAPFDLVKTRLQSDTYMQEQAKLAANNSSKPVTVIQRRGVLKLLHAFVETGHILAQTYRIEGPTALFKGLGPTLVGVIPARSINFFTYGNGKVLFSRWFNTSQDAAPIHLISAASAGIATSTFTNPIWVVKTRIQLDQPAASPESKAQQPAKTKNPATPQFTRSYSPLASYSTTAPVGQHSTARSTSALQRTVTCISQIYREAGVKGFYRGLSASYLGVSEGVIQWTLYEQFKMISARRQSNPQSEASGFGSKGLAAGAAKFIATLITYPHEVVRTRLRQKVPTGEAPRYTGLLQTFNLVWREEGFHALYSGLSPHLLRVIPNAVTLYITYEVFLSFFPPSIQVDTTQSVEK